MTFPPTQERQGLPTRLEALPAEPPQELAPEDLRRLCDPSSLGFRTTAELPELQKVIGQPRAIRALELGSELDSPGYNIFVFGLPGSGRTTLTQEYLERKAAAEPIPDDWCYVNNFDNPHRPRALRLPAGRGSELRKDIQALMAECVRELPRRFGSEEYTRERDRILSELKKNQEAEFLRLQTYAEKNNFTIIRTSFGIVLAPAVGGKALKTEELERLSEEQRLKLQALQNRLSQEVEKTLDRMRALEKAAAEELRGLIEGTVSFLVRPQVEALKARYAGLDPVVAHLAAVEMDIVVNVSQYYYTQSNSHNTPGGPFDGAEWQQRYDVNLLVDNADRQGAPVIYEGQPSYHNLLGRIEHEFLMGASRTDFSMIRPGALHRANGGYLILPVRETLVNPYAWEGLKQALREGCLRIVELGSQLGLLSTVTLEPDPIPLGTKVILVGTPLLFYLLQMYDEDLAKLFKVRAEFASRMERNPQTEEEYGLFVKSVVDDQRLLPFDAGGVARVIEHSARLAEDQAQLSTRFGKIADLISEAAYWAKKGDQVVVTAAAVQRAIDESIYRNNLLEERLQELIAEEILKIEVSGSRTGQINALSLISLGDHAFGRPSRLTASVYPGQGGVIDIERQARLGGPLHTKGVLILGGFLGGRYGRWGPLGLSASLTFEQSYDEVEGDSAAAAELLALLSALAGIPLRQDRAITGSVDQYGAIQAIGGVNEKIEGFFDVCRAKGLTGEGGVLIPAANRRHLMLKETVVTAVSTGQFHIWPVQTIDEALLLLTGCPPGQPGDDGTYPPGTFHTAVVARLEAFAHQMRRFSKDHPEAAAAPREAQGEAEPSNE